MKTDFRKLTLCVALPFITATAVLAVFGFCSISGDFFLNLKKPFLFPGKKFFCLSWAVVCLLCGFAVFRVFNAVTTCENRKNAISSFIISMLFYFLWSVVFFGLKEFFFAAFWFLGLLVFVLSSVRSFKKADVLAGQLLIPQAVMTLYTAYLNLGLALLN